MFAAPNFRRKKTHPFRVLWCHQDFADHTAAKDQAGPLNRHDDRAFRAAVNDFHLHAGD